MFQLCDYPAFSQRLNGHVQSLNRKNRCLQFGRRKQQNIVRGQFPNFSSSAKGDQKTGQLVVFVMDTSTKAYTQMP